MTELVNWYINLPNGCQHWLWCLMWLFCGVLNVSYWGHRASWLNQRSSDFEPTLSSLAHVFLFFVGPIGTAVSFVGTIAFYIGKLLAKIGG